MALRDAYVVHVAAQLVNLGEDPEVASTHAAAVLALETRLAEPQLTGVERRDPSATMHHHSLADVDAIAAAVPLRAHLGALGLGQVEVVNLQQPGYLAALGAILAGTDVAVLRAYARFHLVSSAASTLPEVFDRTDFAFYGRRIRGQQEQHERYKRVIDAIGDDLGEALGQSYVAEAFAPEAKERALAMVEAILDEMRPSIETRTWMTEPRVQRGGGKLDAIRVKIGYPDVWRDWSGLGSGATPTSPTGSARPASSSTTSSRS